MIADPLTGMEIQTVGDTVVTTITLQSGKKFCIVAGERALVRILMRYRQCLAEIRGIPLEQSTLALPPVLDETTPETAPEGSPEAASDGS